MSKGYQNYVEEMENELKRLYAIATLPDRKALNPSIKTECIIAKDIAMLT